ncbi:hypothetical protein J7M28_10520 [bacterium]|nr:hypothetical protein [bacterium]
MRKFDLQNLNLPNDRKRIGETSMEAVNSVLRAWGGYGELGRRRIGETGATAVTYLRERWERQGQQEFQDLIQKRIEQDIQRCTWAFRPTIRPPEPE